MHWFLDPVTQHYADFNGRATRRQYGMFTLISIIVAIVISVASVGQESVVWVYQLAILLPSLSIGVRRLHDLDCSGLWMLMMFIPLLNLALFLGLLIRKGDINSNEYGESPYMEVKQEVSVPQPP
ncbi:DUF805 domain-containing protein, partial [Candidatus Kaiserbacteria bacterium]|nr:DUF805 domain-containing protein [Candidatus Kaiserbacteria bacterium]